MARMLRHESIALTEWLIKLRDADAIPAGASAGDLARMASAELSPAAGQFPIAAVREICRALKIETPKMRQSRDGGSVKGANIETALAEFRAEFVAAMKTINEKLDRALARPRQLELAGAIVKSREPESQREPCLSGSGLSSLDS